ncbi:MAG: hypothetical protein WC307_05025 [Candidatus Nanoarchaeia archaeon]|jgi:hypothetical protein
MNKAKYISKVENVKCNYEIKGLYLTSGGRIVLDCGWGEYFNKGDIFIMSTDDLRKGLGFTKFINKLNDAMVKHNEVKRSDSP